jgi:importin-4
MGNLDLESSTRSAAGQTIMSLIEMRPKLLSKENLVEPILQVFVQAIANSDGSGAGQMFSRGHGGGDDEDDDDDYSPEMEVQEIAQMCLDRMALSIPAKSFVEPAMSLCAQGMASSEMPMRKAGCAVLGIIAEGCSCNIREMLPEILPRLLEAVQDSEYYVRESACFALGQFSEHCQPEILYYHQSILPALFTALEDPRPTVQGTSCYVLENFCENLLPQTLIPFLPMLMERLVGLLHSPVRSTQEMAMAAIASTAVASEDNFLPYAEVSECVVVKHRLLVLCHYEMAFIIYALSTTLHHLWLLF